MNSEDIAMPMDDREFSQSIAKRRTSSGFSAELFVAADLYERGYTVSKPLDGSSKYDLVVDKDGKLFRVQVKSSTGVYIQAQIGWTKYRENVYDGKGVTEHVIRKYNEGDFDVLAIYQRNSKTVYYVPVSDLDLSKSSFQVKQTERDRYLVF